MDRMLEQLKADKWIIVSLLFVNEFIDFCNQQGIYPNGGAFVDGEYAQVLYI
jgi:hypothetical protein